MVRQLSPTKGTMCSTEWCVIQMANSKVRNTPGNSSWTSIVSHFHKRPTSVHPQPVFHLCRWHTFTYCWKIDCVKLCHSQRWAWCSSNLVGQMGNAIQRPEEQTSFDRKEGKAESTCVNERGSHPTSPHPQTSWASAQRVPHMERPYFQCIYRLCPDDWDPATPRRNHSFTSNEEDLHRSHPPSHGIYVRSVERRTHRMSPIPTRLICKKTLIGLASATSQPRNRHSNRQNWF